MTRVAAAAGVEFVVDRHEVSALPAVFHHQDVWHGADANHLAGSAAAGFPARTTSAMMSGAATGLHLRPL